jgi:hypothetical protein
MSFDGDISFTTLDRERLIDTVAVPVDDDDLRAVTAGQPAKDRSGQRSAFPVSLAGYQYTHDQSLGRASYAVKGCARPRIAGRLRDPSRRGRMLNELSRSGFDAVPARRGAQ